MFLGHTHNEELTLDHDLLTTHAAVFGSTGSGKTGLLLGMVEELYDAEVPVILVDIKGDMVNVALQNGLNVRCLTPGGTHGEAVNVLADLHHTETAPTAISALLSMVGEDNDPLTSEAHAFLSAVLEALVGTPTLEDLVWCCQNPVFNTIGALDLEDAFPRKARTNLARKLNTLLVSPSFQAWRLGLDLNIDDLIENKGIVIYSVAHLQNADEQAFAISFLLNEVLRWTKAQKGSDKLRLVLAIDECVGLLPPVANPATKEPIMLLLKQARAFGVGLILATQNPVDIDYKAMSNCATWFVGRMTADRDRKRVLAGMVSAGVSADVDIAGLKPREFVLARHAAGNVFTSRDVSCDLRGPMVPMEITELYDSFNLGYGCGINFLVAEEARMDRKIDEEGESFTTEEIKELSVEEVVEAVDQKIEEEYLLDDWTAELPQDTRYANTIEDFMNKNNNIPNIKEAAIGIGILAVSAWAFIEVFEVAAGFLKGMAGQ